MLCVILHNPASCLNEKVQIMMSASALGMEYVGG